jgi:hypothetical protein
MRFEADCSQMRGPVRKTDLVISYPTTHTTLKNEPLYSWGIEKTNGDYISSREKIHYGKQDFESSS